MAFMSFAARRARPSPDEAIAYYVRYIDLVPGDDVLAVLAQQADEAPAFLRTISAERSLHRYAQGKWSLRESVGHLVDGERLFVFRALWFGRGLPGELPSFDPGACVLESQGDAVEWEAHVAELEATRRSTLAFFRALPAEAWDRRGVASGNSISVRALAWVAAGHVAHHLAVIRERYLA